MPKGLRLKEKVRKESVQRNHKNNGKTGSKLKEKLLKKKRAVESQEQRENRLAAQRDNAKRKCAEEIKRTT